MRDRGIERERQRGEIGIDREKRVDREGRGENKRNT